jgi:hypothetical protein
VIIFTIDGVVFIINQDDGGCGEPPSCPNIRCVCAAGARLALARNAPSFVD